MLPNVKIILGNGNVGSVSLSDDGVAALLLTGAAVENKFALNTHYVLSGTSGLATLGITEANNPLIWKDVNAFYTEAGDGAELHILAVSEATTLTQMVAAAADSPIHKLLDPAAGRIRLVGLNRTLPANYEATMNGCVDGDVQTAVAAAQAIAESYLGKIAPVCIMVPAMKWSGSMTSIYQPREGSQNMVSVILASDGKVGTTQSAAMGMILGRAAKVPVNVSIGRVKDGAICASGAGFLMDGTTPESHYADWNALHDAGYIFFRTYIGKGGYYLNDDATATATTDDYCRLCLTRVIQKAVVICYKCYIDEILDNIDVDPETGKIPTAMAKYYESLLAKNINSGMEGEMSGFNASIDPDQDLITTGKMDVMARITPTALLREIEVNLAFTNPNA